MSPVNNDYGTAIVLQGGGALGAYELGVLKALYEERPGFKPAVITGVSIGAITAAVLAINAADDERNPPETGITEQAMKRVKNGQLLLIPPSEDTRGHGTTAMAKFYKNELAAFLASVPRRDGTKSQ